MNTTTPEIDWAEVRATAWHALRVAIVLTLLAGRLTRCGWDALPGLSERLGKAYARLLVGPEALASRWSLEQLQAMSNRQLRELTGTRRRLAKRQLITIALALA